MNGSYEGGGEELRRTLLRRTGAAGGVLSALLLLVLAALGLATPLALGGLGLIAAVCAAAVVLERRVGVHLVALALIYGVSLGIAVILAVDPAVPAEVGFLGLGLMVLAAGLLLGPRHCRILALANVVNAALLLGRDILGADAVTASILVRGLLTLGFFPAIMALIVPYLEHSATHVEKHVHRLRQAEGLADELGGATGQLEAAAIQISMKSKQQHEGAHRQSSAVREVLEAMRSMSRSSQEIATAAQAVAANADSALTNNEHVGDRMATLSAHIARMTEALQGISEIARKSELLALNASLEGTRAGEAGRGFSLVASEMQRLAERVVTSVREIKTLTADVRGATASTVSSVSEAVEIARATADAARHIRAISQLQQDATDQIAQAMSDIDEVTSHVADGSEQTWVASEELGHVAYRLHLLVEGLFAEAGRSSALPGPPDAQDGGGGEERRHERDHEAGQ